MESKGTVLVSTRTQQWGDGSRRRTHTLALFAVGAVFALIVASFALIVTRPIILDIPLSLIGATGTIAGTIAIPTLVVTITTIIITVATFVIPIMAVIIAFIPVISTGRVVTTTSRGWRATTARRSAVTAAVTTRVETPGSRRRSSSPLIRCENAIDAEQSDNTYLNLQQVIATDPLVVHLMVRIISIATALILHECKPKSY
jgi:hypothetical protein